MRYQGRLTDYVWVSWLLLLLSFCSTASETRFHHFYFSQEHGVPVYLTGFLSATALHSFQQQVPGFQSRRAQLNDHERLLLVSSPDSGRQGILFRPTGIRLYPAGMSSGISKAIPCFLLSPLEIYFSDFSTNPATPYQLWQLPGSVNTRCSHFHYSGTSQVSYFRDLPLAASDALPFPDGTTIIEVPAVGKNTQGAATPGAGGFGLQQLLGAGGGFGSWFDFRPGGGGGGGGYSNLLDISIMPALMAAAENNSDAETSDSEEMIVINIIDSANREWQQTYTKDEAKKLLADIDDGDELISRMQKLQIAVSAEITGNLSSVCREGVQRLGQVLALTHERHGQAIPGVIHLGGGKGEKKDASTQASPESTQQGSGNSGQASSHPRGTTKGGTSGTAGEGDGDDEKEGPQKKLQSPCETSDSSQAAAAGKKSYLYSFKYLDKVYDLKVQSTDEWIDHFICLCCSRMCHQPSTLCGDHFYCKLCLENQVEMTRAENPKCGLCQQNPEKGILEIPAMNSLFINLLAVSCPGHEHGCTETPCIKDLESHCSTCSHIEVKCLNDGCDARVLRCKLPDHKEECGYQAIPCPNESDGCNVTTMRKNMQEHLAVCKYEIIDCPTPECPKKIYRYSEDAHQGVCTFVIVPCDNVFKDNQCHAQCRRGELERHKQTECRYQIISCPDCHEGFARLALSQHSQICGYRQVQCTLCNQPMACRQLLHHQITCFRQADSQKQQNTFSRCFDVCAQAVAREDELLEWLKRMEKQLKSDAGKIEQLSEQCGNSQESIKSFRTEIGVINQKNKELQSTLARFELTIDFADFQLRGYVDDKVLRAFKGEEEINHNGVYCIIPARDVNFLLTLHKYPEVKIDLNVSGAHIILKLHRTGSYLDQAVIWPHVRLLPPDSDSPPRCNSGAKKKMSVGTLDQQGRAYSLELKRCPECHNHDSSECIWKSTCVAPVTFQNHVDCIHNGYLVLLLKLED